MAGSEPEFTYSVPTRFYDNFRAADALKEVKPKLSFAKSPAQKPKEGGNEIDKQNGEPGSQDDSVKPANEDDASCFRVDPDLVESFMDTAASLQLPDARGKLSTPRSSVVLVSRMRGGQSFLDEVVLHLAKELNSTLVSFDQQDLENVGEDFYRQELEAINDGRLSPRDEDWKGPDLDAANAFSDYYFASKAARKTNKQTYQRCIDALSALLDGIKAKNIGDVAGQENDTGNLVEENACSDEDMQPASDDTAKDASQAEDTSGLQASAVAQPPPVLLHIRDAKRLMNDYHCGRRLVARFRDAVNRLREKGENIILVLSFTHIDSDEPGITPDPSESWKVKQCGCWLCECQNLQDCNSRDCGMMLPYRKLHLTKVFTTVLMPSVVPKDWSSPPNTPLESSTLTANINHFKRRLRFQVSQFEMTPSDLLQQSCDWAEFLSEAVKNSLNKEGGWGQDRISDALVPIIGRCVRRRGLEVADIQMVLARLVSDESPEEEKDDTKENKEEKEGEEDPEEVARKAWRARLEEIKAECNDREKKLLDKVVDPGKLKSSFDDVILDQEVIDTVKTLVYLSRLKAEGASQALISQIKIRGAMLYGPPGTGKTHLARAVAKSTGCSMLVLDGSSINSCWVGETEKYIHASFTLAAKLHPCIIFMDEVDSLFYRRTSSDKSWQRAAITQFLQDMDGLAQADTAPFVLVATNRPGDLDSAFIRRLPQKIPFGLPNLKARAGILRLFLKEDDLDGVDVDNLAAVTEGYSGSDLKSLCAEAGLMWAVEQQLGLKKPTEDKPKRPDSEAEQATEQDQVQQDKSEPTDTQLETDEQTPGSPDPHTPDSDSAASSTTSESDGSSVTSTADTSDTSASEASKSEEEVVLKLRLTSAHFEKALEKIVPSISTHDVKEMEEFARRYNVRKRTVSKVR